MAAYESSSELSPTIIQERLVIEPIGANSQARDSGEEVVLGLTRQPKSLSPKYLYDDRGSELFEQITQLPEYYPTRTETAILKAQSAAIAQLTGPCELIELGSGSSTKTRFLLDAYQQLGASPLHYVPIDVSGGMLKEAALHLLEDYAGLTIHGLTGTYGAALAALPPQRLPARMIAFIGSSLGNLTVEESDRFFAQISAALSPGDYCLLGVDLEKDVAVLEPAYDDSQGVTAAFTLNLLHHLNWRFQGNFQPDQFRHVAFYNPTDHQIEIYLESLQDQTARLDVLDLEVSFTAGERLMAEISRKFNLQELEEMLEQHGFGHVKTFTDERQWFALMLYRKRG